MLNNIKTYRELRGFTQFELAEKVGVSQPAIQRIESGTLVPNILLGYKIAKALGASIDDVWDVRTR